jgi:polysaccharide deacetylase family protein (PEP-CTERM system associated)
MAAEFRDKPLAVARRQGRVVNAMSVDVEDFFHAQALAAAIPRSRWEAQPQRVEAATDRILALFECHGVRATFFILSWVAERCPGLIRRIAAAGHELASHGREHGRVDLMGADAFRDDVRRSKRIIEDIGGGPVAGFRAPTFSIGRDSLWAFEVLAEEGYTYSSSIYPVRRDYYGMAEAPRTPFLPSPRHAIEEYPITTLRLAGRTLPCGGGGFFRLLPYQVSRAAIARVNREQRPAIFYIHPWELDPGQPRVAGLSLKARLRHTLNLSRTEARLDRLAADFAWDRMDAVFRPGVA